MLLSSRFLLIVVPLAALPFIYLTGRWERRWNVAQAVSLVVLLGVWGLFISAASAVYTRGAPLEMQVGAVAFRVDGLSVLYAGLTLVLGTLAVLYSGRYVAGEVGEEKYYAMLTGMIGAMIGLACAADVFNLWVWFELMVVTSYLLVAFHRENAAALEACVKYLVQSAVGSVFVVFGIALLLAQTGTVNLEQLAASTPASMLTTAAGVFFVTGFGIKIAIVPLHTWLPDAHSQSPSAISAMLSGVVIEGGIVALLRVIGVVEMNWGVTLMVLGAVNIFIGNLLALRQQQVKRLLAYSSVSHIGYMLFGFGIGFYAADVAGIQSGLLHLINHGLMKGAAFLAAGALMFGLNTHAPLEVGDLAGMGKRYPLLCMSMAVALLGLGGIPPLAGFVSKMQIFISGVNAGSGFITGLVVFAALNTLISIGYYLRLIGAMYAVDAPSRLDDRMNGRTIPNTILVPILLLVLAVVVLGVLPGLLNTVTAAAAQAIF